MLGDKDIELDTRKKYLIGLTIISIIYIVIISNLNYIYDWDTITRALWLKQGIYANDAGVTHFLISILAGFLVHLGVEPLSSFRFFTSLFMFILVIVIHEFAHRETNNEFLAFSAGLFILFNFGFTYLLTSLEDNIWMYGGLILFVYYLYSERWAVSALFLSLSILMHIQCEVFIPWFLLYLSQKLNFSMISEDEGVMKKVSIAFSNVQMQKFIIATVFLLTPLLFAYSYLILMRGWKLNNFVDNFLASGPAYHGDAGLWFFSANRTINDQLDYVYSGYVSTFVCRFPDFLKSMPHADYFGAFFAILVSYLLFRALSFNLKTLCAIPTFLILFFHVLVFESWSIERWDFFPFFIVYFVAVGYSKKPEGIKKSIRVIFTLLVIISFTFTFASFNCLCGFQESALCAYGDRLGASLDNRSVAVETTFSPDGISGRYLRYQCNDSIIFINPDDNSTYNNSINISYINYFISKNIYTSNSSFLDISNIFSKIKWDKELIWLNSLDTNLSLIRATPTILSSISGMNNMYSRRIDGSRKIAVYRSPDNKTRCTVINNTQPTDFGKDGLLEELLWAKSEYNTHKMDGRPSILEIDGHTAMSVKTMQADLKSELRINNRPDLYLTAIGYPEKNAVLTIACIGDAVTWDTEKKMANMFKL